MKKIYILLVAIFAISSTSCSDYLDSDYIFEDRETIDKVFTDYKKTEQWLAQAYTYLLGQCCDVASKRNTPFVFDDCMYYGDDDVTVDATKGGALSYNKFREGAYDENTFQDTWNRCYNGIRQASIFIQYADMSIEHSAEEIIDLKAQARFVRAYYYWLLLRKYGPIPLVPDEGFDYNQSYEDLELPRNTYDECVDYIAKEMVLAAQGLPLKRDQLSITRPTRGAALATRALAMLYAASPLMNGNDDAYAQQMTNRDGKRLLNPVYDNSKWAKAAAACKDVMGLGVYHIYTADFRSTHSIAFPATIAPPIHPEYSYKNFPEGWQNIDPFESYRSLFNGQVTAMDNPELIFTRGNNGLGDGVNSMANDQMPGSAGGNNCHGLTAKQCDAYALANGEPFDLNKFLSETPVGERFVTEQEVNEGKYPQVRSGVWKEYANREPRFYASVAFNGAFWPFASARDGNYRNLQMWYYRGNTNGRTNASDKWQPTGIGMMKYINPKDCNTNNGKIYDKVDCAIRYADILLMYAEALNELTPGSSFEVATWDGIPYTISRDKEEMSRAISQIRIRGGVPDYEEQVYEDSGELRKYLKRERQIELLGENQRYYDLRRWKDVEKEEAEPVYGCNVLMTQAKAEDFYDRVRVEKLQTSFSRKMYFWPIDYGELKHNKRMTQAPGWKTYD